MDHCPCLSHVWSRHWLAVTGDTPIVHAQAVLGRNQAGWYLAKYMDKTLAARRSLQDRGFKRRWSSSRTWPGGGRLRLWQTTHGGWARHTWSPGRPRPELVAWSDQSLLRRDGEDLTLLLATKRDKLRRVAAVERLIDVTTSRA